ncbi:MAG: hypothetical protein RIR88_677, partial [Actinomycetota bacterium]
MKTFYLATALVVGFSLPLASASFASATSVCTPQPLVSFVNGSFESPVQSSGGVYINDGL